MAALSDTLHFSNSSTLTAKVSSTGSWTGLGNFTVAGLLVVGELGGYYRIAKYVGESNVPGDIKRLRRSVYELMRRMGQPVLIKHMFNDSDVAKGIAEKSPNFIDPYGQVRNHDPLSHGIGFVSREKSIDEWIALDGTITNVNTGGLVPAPKYRGFGPGYLTYIIEPDAAEDLYRPGTSGALIKVQIGTAQAAWFPDINDNDLIINVEIDGEGDTLQASDRYVARETNPITIRGLDTRGRREFSGDRGNAHLINQNFQMTLVPDFSPLQEVEIDR